jgi:hypothetical protein
LESLGSAAPHFANAWNSQMEEADGDQDGNKTMHSTRLSPLTGASQT